MTAQDRSMRRLDQRIRTPTTAPGVRLAAVFPRDAGRAPRPALPRYPVFPAQDTLRPSKDSQFSTLCIAYDTHGGLVGGDELAHRLRPHLDQPISVVARWIVQREIVNIYWRSQWLIPMFQFSASDMRIHPAVRGAMTELTSVLDDWDIATWFVQPNTWLNDNRPLDRLQCDAAAVIRAARAGRSVANG